MLARPAESTLAVPYADDRPSVHHAVDPAEAEAFVRQVHAELPTLGPVADRVAEVRREIARSGTYRHTVTELEHGARTAWRNSARCIGRLYWRSLVVRDARHVTSAEGMVAECVEHLRFATNGGRVRPTITVFPQAAPDGTGPRILGDQLIRYAGYRGPAGVIGDPSQVAATDRAMALGWADGQRSAFDVLPLIVQNSGGALLMAELPRDAVLEVELAHPDLRWFADLGLRWHAVPAIARMPLEVGGIVYTAAPFNGWYLGTEIGARNLADADRYDRLPEIARRMGLDTTSDRTMWKDRALIELNVAVLHSFDRAGVTVADHHSESERFLTHLAREEAAGRVCPADWSWIVPPISGSATAVFHRYYDEGVAGPRFRSAAEPTTSRCPHRD
jgi:nitric-oxide synthase